MNIPYSTYLIYSLFYSSIPAPTLWLTLVRKPQGISLPLDQFNTLITVLPEIETALASKGQSISRPDYSNAGASASSAAAMDEDEDEDEVEKVQKTMGKKNFEETSDEE